MKELSNMTEQERLKTFIAVGKDLQEVCVFENPSIVVKNKTAEEILTQIMGVSKYIEPTDFIENEEGLKLSDDTRDLLEQLDLVVDGKPTRKALRIPDPDEEMKKEEIIEKHMIEPEVEDVEEINVKAEIEAAGKLKELKDIVRTYDEFKEIRGVLSSYSNTENLKKRMLDILSGHSVVEKEKEEKIKKAADSYRSVKTGRIGEYEKHSFNIVPQLNKEDEKRLEESLLQGYLSEFPIYLYEGKILDGWQRYRICQKHGIEPLFQQFEGTPSEAVNFVLSTNKRRSLTASQWAVIANEAEDLLGFIKKQADANIKSAQFKGKKADSSQLDGRAINSPTGRTAEKLADIFDVSPAYIKQAKRIQKQYPEDYERVKSGEKTITNVIDAHKKKEKKIDNDQLFYGTTVRMLAKALDQVEDIFASKSHVLKIKKTEHYINIVEGLFRAGQIIRLYDIRIK